MKSMELARRTTLREFIFKTIEDEAKLIQQKHNPPTFSLTKTAQEEM